MDTVAQPQDRREAIAFATTIAQEIADAFQEHSPHFETIDGKEKPTRFTVVSASLKDQSVQALESLVYGFAHSVSYGSTVRLRKGFGIIAKLIQAEGVYTGEVQVQAALDEYDI